MKLEFSEHNFNVLQEAYGEIKTKYHERGMSMRDTGDIVRSLFMPYLRRIKAARYSEDPLAGIDDILEEFEKHTPL